MMQRTSDIRYTFTWLGRSAAGLACLAASFGVAQAVPCPSAGGEPVTVTKVEDRLELRLADGRLIRLAGLDPALDTPDHPDQAETTRVAFAALFDHQTMTAHIVSARPDRWGRITGLAFASGGPAASQSGGLATAAVASGLGRYLAEPASSQCRDALIDAEAKARQAKLGLWADPYYAVLAVDDRKAFAERSGTIVVAEGRLVAVQPGPYRTKLRLAPGDRGSYGGHVLVATILPHTMKAFESRHVDLASLTGKTLRIRGLLDLRFGPQIELAGPDVIEVVPPPPSGALETTSN